MRVESAPGDDVLEMDPGKNFRFGSGTLRFGLDHAIEDRLPRLFQNHDHIERGAGRRTGQYEFHRPRAKVPSAILRRPIDHDGVSATGFADKTHAFDPFHPGLHRVSSVSRSTQTVALMRHPPALWAT